MISIQAQTPSRLEAEDVAVRINMWSEMVVDFAFLSLSRLLLLFPSPITSWLRAVRSALGQDDRGEGVMRVKRPKASFPLCHHTSPVRQFMYSYLRPRRTWLAFGPVRLMYDGREG